MTEPSAVTFCSLITGWVLAPRRTIRGMVRACGTDRHHAALHRLFASASWSIDQAGLAVFDLLKKRMPNVFLTLDDTLFPRLGLKIFGTGFGALAGRLDDAPGPGSLQSFHAVTRWGHCQTFRRKRLNVERFAVSGSTSNGSP